MRLKLLLTLMCVLAACRPKLDEEAPKLKAPSSLPVFVQEPLAVSLMLRATELANEATVSLAQHDVKKAIPLLTEALTIDGSHEQARWLLAQTFLSQGLGSVALKLIAPLAERQNDSGWCLEFLQKVKQDKSFERLVKSSEGHALLADVSDTPLPYATWGKALAAALKGGKLDEIAKYAHPVLPFALTRACPGCEDPAKKAKQVKQLQGASMLVKVASRFDLVRTENAGIPLIVEGEPVCKDRCCTWQTPKTLAPLTAALERVCLRPTLPTQPSLTELSLVFGAASRGPGAPTLR